MKLKEITKKEWNELLLSDATYCINGCIFWVRTENLVAFHWYENSLTIKPKYFKVVKENPDGGKAI